MQLQENQKVIQSITLIDQNAQLLDANLLIKAYLRRALAYERLDKGKLAVQDFQRVKALDQWNKQASDGLHRLRKEQEEMAIDGKREKQDRD
jgi:hypothetical protein